MEGNMKTKTNNRLSSTWTWSGCNNCAQLLKSCSGVVWKENTTPIFERTLSPSSQRHLCKISLRQLRQLDSPNKGASTFDACCDFGQEYGFSWCVGDVEFPTISPDPLCCHRWDRLLSVHYQDSTQQEKLWDPVHHLRSDSSVHHLASQVQHCCDSDDWNHTAEHPGDDYCLATHRLCICWVSFPRLAILQVPPRETQRL